MNDDTLEMFATHYTAAWNSQDAASVAAFFAEDGTLFVNGTPAVGREAITGVVQGFMSAFPDLELFLDALEIHAGQVTYHWTFVGTNTGPGGGGHTVRFSGYEEWTFAEDDLIASSMGYFDNEEYRSQLEHGFDAGHP
ncbi:MAG: nuclear transport factor 2 family protein [Gammaproteobacteria bacterium]|nr:nuclear transport factor 2 family protein [Gammaproteobacteria bacterium]